MPAVTGRRVHSLFYDRRTPRPFSDLFSLSNHERRWRQHLKAKVCRHIFLITLGLSLARNLSCDEQWLPHLHHAQDSSALWNRHDSIEHAHGLQDSYEWLNSYGNYETNTLLEGGVCPYYLSGQTLPTLSWDNLYHNNDATSIGPQKHEKIGRTNCAGSSPVSLHWTDSMSSAAHSDFFALDVNVNNSDHLQLTADMVEQAQKNLQGWTELTLKTELPFVGVVNSVSAGSSPPEVPSSPHSLPTARSSDSKVSKTFHFVANSDKKTATRIRNTLASRNLRQSKINRIAQLERELEKQLQEADTWRQRAIEAGWKE